MVVLLHQIMNRLHARTGAAPPNFTAQLPAADFELAQQLTCDPYVLVFLDRTGPVAERDLATALVDRLQTFLLELGHGFAFVYRQYHFAVNGDDFSIDPLFFNWAQSRFVVVELRSALSPPSTSASSASTSPGSTTNSASPTGTPPPSASCSAPGGGRPGDRRVHRRVGRQRPGPRCADGPSRARRRRRGWGLLLGD